MGSNERTLRLPRFLLIGLLAALLPLAADADSGTRPIVLEHLTTTDGLPQGTVFATLQDSQGFVWLGTEDGLVRYDGVELVRYAYSPKQRDGLAANFIGAIVEDAHHDLWIAVKGGGVARWNRSTDRFVVYRHDPANPNSLASDAARALIIDGEGSVWVGLSDAGIDVLDPATGHIAHHHHDSSAPDSLVDDRIQTLTRDRSGTIWAGTGAGLDRWQAATKTFVHYRHQPADSHSLSSDQISCVLEDETGSLWIGTFDGGLNRMDRTGRVDAVYRHVPSGPTSIANDDVRAVLEDSARNLWVGTAEGLDHLDIQTGRFVHYRHDERDAGSLRDSFVMSLYRDNGGLVWIGTRSGGVSRWNPRSWELGGQRPEWLANKMVTAFADAPEHRVWVGSLGGGLVRFDATTGEWTDIDKIVGRRDAIGDRRVMALHTDRRGVLWIGTMRSGVKKLPPDGQVQSVPVRIGDPHSTSAPGVMTIFEARNGQLWIGTHGGGANVIDPASGLIRQLPFDTDTPGATSSAIVTAFAEDRNGNIWIGTDGGGLDIARPDGAVFKVLRHNPNNLRSLSSNTIYGITIDADGRVWLATDGGGLELVAGSPAAAEQIHFEHISRADGLTSDTIWGVLIDAAGRLWLSGNAGLMRYDRRTQMVKTFHVEQGLQGEEFNYGSYLRLRDGRFCFGGPGGFNIFDPEELTEQLRPPALALMQVDVLGAHRPTATPYWLLDQIRLDYHASVLSLDFGTLDFTSPKHNRLAYRIKGLADKWIDLGTQHRVTLTNLDAGDHLLEVRAASADSVWSDVPLQLKIHRDPPPWKSQAAIVVYAAGTLSLLAMGVWWQRRRSQRASAVRERLEAEVAARTRDLVASNRLLEEAAQAKSAFLARMTHELRTPMNGVFGMTELLERTALSSVQERLTKTIRLSTGVLLQIVNDLLDLSKAQSGKIVLESIPIDLGLLLDECSALLAEAAATKGIDLIVCPPNSYPRPILGDPLRIRQILLNLIGNAVKFTEHGQVAVEANIGEAVDGRASVEITIVDTGIGMDATAISRIFEPFAQADESTSRRFGGTGLGLSICRELATVMGGSITVDSQPGIGSTFRVRLGLKSGVEGQLPGAPARLQGRVQIMTRTPILAKALFRHAQQFGLTVRPVAPRDHESLGESDDLLIVDAGTRADVLRSNAAARNHGSQRIVVVAHPSELAGPDMVPLLETGAIVSKPVHRAELHRAISVALGTPASKQVVHESPTARTTDPIRGHVLVVDDEPVNGAVAEGFLEALGCSSIWVDNGSAAIRGSITEQFDLILMDINMPVMDGYQTTAAIRQLPDGRGQHLPIIAVTANAMPGDEQKCLTAGMNGFLVKPFTLAELQTLLARWLPAGSEAPAGGVAAQRAEPIANMGSRSSEPINLRTLATLREIGLRSGKDLLTGLLQRFLSSADERLTQIEDAVAACDGERVRRAAHALKSSTANLGAEALADCCRRLEDCGRNSRLHDAPALLAQLRCEQNRAVARFRELLQEAA